MTHGILSIRHGVKRPKNEGKLVNNVIVGVVFGFDDNSKFSFGSGAVKTG